MKRNEKYLWFWYGAFAASFVWALYVYFDLLGQSPVN